MQVFKNSYGQSIAFTPKIHPKNYLGKFSGSSLGRKEKRKQDLIDYDPIEKFLKAPLRFSDDNDGIDARKLSQRSKTKIRQKVIAFSRIQKSLTFVTLTFLNNVSDRHAIKILQAFLDNVSKRHPGFQYLWVVEKQTKNRSFANNIHFHLITNLRWDIKRWWNYWIDVQIKQGILPQQSHYKPSSAFDVKYIKSKDIKSVGNYITKYITKNESAFHGALWYCSKKISELYTNFYSDKKFMEEFNKLQEKGLLKGKIVQFEQEHCTVYLVPLNRLTSNFYNCIDEINRVVWKVDVSINSLYEQN